MYKKASEYMPYESISLNLLLDNNCKKYPFFSGTGFFVQFQPYDYVFYITARHCFRKIGNSNAEKIEVLKIPYKLSDNIKPTDQTILFSEILLGQDKDDDELEDLIVFVVDETISKKKIDLLKKRSLKALKTVSITMTCTLEGLNF